MPSPEFSKLGVFAVLTYCGLLVTTVPPIIPLFAFLLPWSIFTGVPKELFFAILFVIVNGLIVYVLVAAIDRSYKSEGPLL